MPKKKIDTDQLLERLVIAVEKIADSQKQYIIICKQLAEATIDRLKLEKV